MGPLPIRILLHGLIAIVPANGPNGANHMTALLVDGRMPHAQECAAAHMPALDLLVTSSAACSDALCDVKGGTGDAVHCVCGERALAGKNISIQVTPESSPGAPVRLNTSVPAPLPQDATEAADFSYLANLSQPPFNLKLDPQYLSAHPPANLLARMEIAFTSATACALSSRDDGGETYVHAMGWRKLHDSWRAGEKSQALAQGLLAKLDGPAIPGQGSVKLVIRSFGDTHEQALELVPDQDGYVIDVSNEAESLRLDDPCDDGIGRHFAHFYELAEKKPLWDDRLIPHLRLTERTPAKDLVPQACIIREHVLSNHPICAMAAFNQ